MHRGFGNVEQWGDKHGSKYHGISSCVQWGSTNTSWHIGVHYMHIHKSVKLKHNGIWGWGIYGLDGMGHLCRLNGWGIYGLNGWGSYGKVSYCFFGEICSKITGLQGSTLSGPRMTTGFGPFELPTRGLLQKGRD